MLNSLNMLKNDKAPGPDGIPTNLVTDDTKFIANPLAMIFNASLAQGIFHNILKLAKLRQFSNLELKMRKIITGLFRFYPFSLSYLKKCA